MAPCGPVFAWQWHGVSGRLPSVEADKGAAVEDQRFDEEIEVVAAAAFDAGRVLEAAVGEDRIVDGTLDGGTLDGGTLDGGTLDGGTLDGGTAGIGVAETAAAAVEAGDQAVGVHGAEGAGAIARLVARFMRLDAAALDLAGADPALAITDAAIWSHRVAAVADRDALVREKDVRDTMDAALGWLAQRDDRLVAEAAVVAAMRL